MKRKDGWRKAQKEKGKNILRRIKNENSMGWGDLDYPGTTVEIQDKRVTWK